MREMRKIGSGSVPWGVPIHSLIDRSAAFADLSGPAKQAAADAMALRSWKQDDVIIRQGDLGDWMLLVAEGSVRVEVHTDEGRAVSVGTMASGDLVGEMALITREPRMADVVAATDVVAYALTTDAFDQIATAHPELSLVLTRVMTERLGAGGVDGLAGKYVEQYRILRGVGSGAMGSVYEAVDEQANTRVALKMMRHRLIFDPEALVRFQREADALERIEHENVSRVYARCQAYRTYWIAMEFCDGPTLQQRIFERGRLTETETRAVLGQAARALSVLHAHGVIHRDIKPSNLILTAGDVLKITDFGLAKLRVKEARPELAEVRSVLGTPYFMPPETLTGAEAGPASDVYALACVALTCLDGHYPFEQKTYADLLEAKRAFTPPAAADLGVSAEVREVLATALHVQPERRIAALAEIATWTG
jgi:tRNA A-37 threonylcarbamoyl transferase component Bud32